MYIKAYGKINIGLYVGDRLPNGYHEITTLIQQIDLYDEMFFALMPNRKIKIECKNMDIEDKDNLVYKAASAFIDLTGTEHGLHVKMVKNIPSGAGLGGGSSNAANTLLAFKILTKLEIDLDDLLDMAREIGSDIPYFFYGEPSIVEGMGDIVTPFQDMPKYHALLIAPNFTVSTGWAYHNLKNKHIKPDSELSMIPVTGFKEELLEKLSNDFEPLVFAKYPILSELKSKLLEGGAVFSSLTGTGSAVFGLYRKPIPESFVKELEETYPEYKIIATTTI